MKRRKFVKSSMGATAGISLLGLSTVSCSQSQKGESTAEQEQSVEAAETVPLGIQLYSLAVILSEDFEGTIRQLASTGYKKLEFAGPYYYSPQEEIDNNILISRMGLNGYGYYNYTPGRLRNLLDELEMTAPSAHVSLISLEHDLEEAINAAKIIGHQYLTIPMMIKTTEDEWKAFADQLNEIGEACQQQGIGLAYHNHSQEFAPMQDETIMDMLLDRTDPDKVSFELDLFWATVAGVNATEYLQAYPDRFKMLHVKDMKTVMDAPNTDGSLFSDPQRIRPIIGNQTIVGEGVIDFQTILGEAEKVGVEHLFIESDFPPDPGTFATKSFENLDKMLNG